MAVRFRFEPSGVEVSTDCHRNLNLLGHSQLEELRIGSRCGGHGICGGDRVRALPEDQSKLSPPTAAERRHLSPEEIAEGWRLACQCWPASDHEELVLSVADQLELA